VLLPLVRLVESLSSCIKAYDERIEKLAAEKYPHTDLLRQVKGVGSLTALAYVLTLEDPKRFAKSRDVGAYLGLVPKQEDSGDRQPQLRITKMGDCGGCWWGARTLSWVRSGRIQIYAAMGCGCARWAGRMRRSERWWRWRASWLCCCTGCG
jgi:Transposase IS116/IS110/IS902 family